MDAKTRIHKPLTETAIKRAGPRGEPYKLRDGRGLYLLIQPNGARRWLLRFTLPGRMVTYKGGKPRIAESMLSLGEWPDVSLEDARERRDAERKIIAKGIDPAQARREERGALISTFEHVARECMEKQQKALAPSTFERFKWIMETLVFPYIGNRPIKTLSSGEVRAVLARIDSTGTHVTARRTAQRINQIMEYAAATGRLATPDAPAWKFTKALTKPAAPTHHAAITDPVGVGELLRKIDGFTGAAATLYALKLSALLFARPGEIRRMEWAECDLKGATWRLPAAKMKSRKPHIVPLPTQAVALLAELRALTGRGKYVFSTGSVPMSENTVNAALRALGYAKGTHTAHGFRSMASTLLNEGFGGQTFAPDWVEMQLAHSEADSTRAAYNAAKYLPQRRAMMQAYADYLAELRAAK